MAVRRVLKHTPVFFFITTGYHKTALAGFRTQFQRLSSLRADETRQSRKQFRASARVDPPTIVTPKVESAGSCRHPDLLHRRLAVDDDFRSPIDKLDFQHVSADRAFDIAIGTVCRALQFRFDPAHCRLCQRKEFCFSHAKLQSNFIQPDSNRETIFRFVALRRNSRDGQPAWRMRAKRAFVYAGQQGAESSEKKHHSRIADIQAGRQQTDFSDRTSAKANRSRGIK